METSQDTGWQGKIKSHNIHPALPIGSHGPRYACHMPTHCTSSAISSFAWIALDSCRISWRRTAWLVACRLLRTVEAATSSSAVRIF